jgi:hypothetical protein
MRPELIRAVFCFYCPFSVIITSIAPTPNLVDERSISPTRFKDIGKHGYQDDRNDGLDAELGAKW